MHTPHILAREQIGLFALAGSAIFTVVNRRTGNRFTYHVEKSDRHPTLYFVSILTGPENTSDYAYLGIIRDGRYWHGKKSQISAEAQSNQAFAWVWEHLERLPACIEVWHEGRCGRCNRTLTVPESIASGYGPECRQLLGL